MKVTTCWDYFAGKEFVSFVLSLCSVSSNNKIISWHGDGVSISQT